jgi:Cys-tRNA(Pro) deacylase
MSDVMPPVTLAAEVLRAAGVAFTTHLYACEDKSSTEVCARELNVDEHAVVKTILVEADGKPFIVLMHGDMRASAKCLAAIIGAKNIVPCLPDKAEEYTGYETGGISPFGTRMEIPVYMEETILNLRKIYVNGGKRGYLIGMDPYDVVRVLRPTLVKVGSARAA